MCIRDSYYSQHHDWHQQQQHHQHYGGVDVDPSHAYSQGGGGAAHNPPSSWGASPYNNNVPQPTTARPKPIDASNSPSEGQISVSPAKSTTARHTNNPYRFN
eukprot:TRINITY_DN11523_c0_g1_i1.p1 TRINITY_DN11523_c0_g1~~TRINITY_DN11523_c0_g1_i1.p1  ORF type:complete len:102 (+),score=11.79 TRINITY_DN11523_c0_g1_i1:132-437(+)